MSAEKADDFSVYNVSSGCDFRVFANRNDCFGGWLNDTNDFVFPPIAASWEVFILAGIVLSGIVGNVLVCAAIIVEKKLQNITNAFLMSLAIADLLVTMLVMPCSIIHQIVGYWPFGLVLCDSWQVADVMLCTSSIMHMCIISIDRYIRIKNPLKTRNASKLQVGLKIGGVWLISFMISSPIIILGVYRPQDLLTSDSQCGIFNRYFVIYGSLAAFFIPLCLMLGTYGMTINILREKMNQGKKQGVGELRRTRSRKRRYKGRRGKKHSRFQSKTGTKVTAGDSPHTGTDADGSDELEPLNPGKHEPEVKNSPKISSSSAVSRQYEFSLERENNQNKRYHSSKQITRKTGYASHVSHKHKSSVIKSVLSSIRQKTQRSPDNTDKNVKPKYLDISYTVANTQQMQHLVDNDIGVPITSENTPIKYNTKDQQVEGGTEIKQNATSMGITNAGTSEHIDLGIGASANLLCTQGAHCPEKHHHCGSEDNSSAMDSTETRYSALGQSNSCEDCGGDDAAGKWHGSQDILQSDNELATLIPKTPEETRLADLSKSSLELLERVPFSRPIHDYNKRGKVQDSDPSISTRNPFPVMPKITINGEELQSEDNIVLMSSISDKKRNSCPGNTKDTPKKSKYKPWPRLSHPDTSTPLMQPLWKSAWSRLSHPNFHTKGQKSDEKSDDASGANSSTGQSTARFKTLVKKHSAAFRVAAILSQRRENARKKEKELRTVKTERKAVKVLGTMFAMFVICWAPFFTLNLALGICYETCTVEPIVFVFSLWLGYLSSIINPIIYTIFNQTFKATFIRLLCCKLRKSYTRNTSYEIMKAGTKLAIITPRAT